ncbi:MAG: acyl-CoA thioesterase [Burkholderiaceae bacterium]
MRTFVLKQRVDFGDCDPAGIVFYPNCYRWFDRATHHLFAACGYTFGQVRRDLDLIAWPLADAGARFRLPVTAGDEIEIHSTVTDINDKTFRVQHRIRRDGELMVDGFEVRFLARQIGDEPVRLQTVPMPEAMRAGLR